MDKAHLEDKVHSEALGLPNKGPDDHIENPGCSLQLEAKKKLEELTEVNQRVEQPDPKTLERCPLAQGSLQAEGISVFHKTPTFAVSTSRAKEIPIIKYTSYGNNFVILDETQKPILTESEKSRFAYQATNINYGIGSDNFLIMQSCRPEILKGINNVRHYWEDLPDAMSADYIFRMFEPDGEEAFSCGNGLMSIAAYLFKQYGAESARIMTEIPTPRPRVVSIGTDLEEQTNWANMGYPRKIPDEIAHPSLKKSIHNDIDLVENITIDNFRKTDGMRFFTNESSLSASGYLVYTGEPHFVIFADSGFSLKDLGNHCFVSYSKKNPFIKYAEKRTSFSSDFVDFIGNYFAREYVDLFPAGININFVRIIDESKTLEYRCFERGINHETLACGTGALASAYVAKELEMVKTNQISVWPHRCRWDDPDAEIRIEECESGWLIYGNPRMLFEGTFLWG